MEDTKITELLFQKDERGLSALKAKYCRLMMKICRGLLRAAEDAEDVLNDSLLAVWESIPPSRPDDLAAYVCKISRRLSVNKLRYNTAKMRSSDMLTELDECVPYNYTPETAAEEAELSRAINDWLKSQSERQQKLFTLRYFYAETVKSAARACSMTENAGAAALMRMRKSLKSYLAERGMFYE